MVSMTLRFLEVSIESWFEWDLKSRTLNSTQTIYAIRPHSEPTLNSCSNIIFYSVFTFHFDHCHHHLGNLAKSRKRKSKINLLNDAHNCLIIVIIVTCQYSEETSMINLGMRWSYTYCFLWIVASVCFKGFGKSSSELTEMVHLSLLCAVYTTFEKTAWFHKHIPKYYETSKPIAYSFI